MIAVFGADGFLGRHVLRRLACEGRRVRAISRTFRGKLESEFGSNVEFVEADLRDVLDAGSTLQDVDTVIQLASTSSPGMGSRYNVADVEENVVPHVALIQNAVARGIGRYVFISSGGTVYGPSAKIPIHEESPTNPICSHGVTKLTIEHYLKMHGYVDGLDYVILRVSTLFGPGQTFKKGQGLIPAILDRYDASKPIHILGDGSARRDYLYVDDAVDAIVASIDNPTARQSVMNVGSGTSRSILDIVHAVEQQADVRFTREYLPARPTDVAVNQLDISRAGQILGWYPETDLLDGLRATLAARAGLL